MQTGHVGWASNNNVLVNNESKFETLAAQTAINGEPGYIFMDNIQAFSRMCDPPTLKMPKPEAPILVVNRVWNLMNYAA